MPLLFKFILYSIAGTIFIITVVDQLCISAEKRNFLKLNSSLVWRTTKGERVLKWLKIISFVLVVATVIFSLKIQ